MKKSKRLGMKATLSTVLGILVFGMLGINELILRSDLNADSLDRTPASEIYRTIRSGSFVAERKLASELSEFKDRTLASIGRSANPFDQFRFGILEGKYALTFDGEKIKDVSFVADVENTQGAPTKVVDRVEFLKKYSQLLSIKRKIERVATDIRGPKIIETYKAYLPNDQQVFVKVEVDELDRLYNLQVL